jgi:maltose O-acetyltransferase
MNDFLARLRGDLCRFRHRFNPNIRIGAGLRLYCRLEFWGAGRVVIGNNCVMRGIPGEGRKWNMLHTMDKDALIEIGDRAQLAGTRITAKFAVHIGNDALLEETVIIDTDFHSILPDRTVSEETLARCGIHIGDRAAVGARTMITKGLTIGPDVMLLPGSIVTKNIPALSIAGGNPAKVMRQRENIAADIVALHAVAAE